MDGCTLPCVPQSHVYADIDFNVRSLLLVLGGMSTLDEDNILEVEDIYHLREEMDELMLNMSFYLPRMNELHERISSLKETVDNFTKQEMSAEQRIRLQYQLKWTDIQERFTDQSRICSKERQRINELEIIEIRYKRTIENKNIKIKVLEERTATLTETNEKLIADMTHMKEWNVTFANKKEWLLKQAYLKLDVCAAQLSFLKETLDHTIGMRMYDEWVFDKSRIEQYWDIQITKTLNVIQNVYNIRLEAEKRYLEQQYESKEKKAKLEVKEFAEKYQRQLEEIQDIAAKVQDSWDRKSSNCSSWHDRQKCTRLSGEFRIMMDIVVSGFEKLKTNSSTMHSKRTVVINQGGINSEEIYRREENTKTIKQRETNTEEVNQGETNTEEVYQKETKIEEVNQRGENTELYQMETNTKETKQGETHEEGIKQGETNSKEIPEKNENQKVVTKRKTNKNKGSGWF